MRDRSRHRRERAARTSRRYAVAVAALLTLMSCGTESSIDLTTPAERVPPPSSAPPSAPGTPTSTPSVEPSEEPTSLSGLVVAAEPVRTGYSRERFGKKDWIDADGDSCDTREEVLIEESRIAATLGPGCKVLAGSWLSTYDGVSYTTPAKLQIDHFVPLGEAWDSGAKKWTPTKRERYANYLDDPGHLIAVTGAENGSKGDRDPAEWLPDREAVWCTYAQTWIAIKVHWKLRADQDEVDALRTVLEDC